MDREREVRSGPSDMEANVGYELESREMESHDPGPCRLCQGRLCQADRTGNTQNIIVRDKGTLIRRVIVR